MISDKDKIKSKKRKENQTKLYKYIYIDAKNQCKFWVTWWDHVESTKTIGEEYERIRIERGGQDRYSSVFPQAYATIVFHRILPLPCPLITIVTIHWRFTLTRPKYITVDDTEKNSQTALHKGRRRSLDHVQTTKAAVTFYYRGCHSRLAHFVQIYSSLWFSNGRRSALLRRQNGYVSLPGNILSKPVREGASLVNFFFTQRIIIHFRSLYSSSLFYRPLITKDHGRKKRRYVTKEQ